MVYSMERWKEKVAVVTGASSGIGEKVVEQLVAAGVKVVGLIKTADLIKDGCTNLDTKSCYYAIKCDVTKEDEVVSAFKTIKEHFGALSILVNCAGVVGNTNLIDGDAAVWKSILDVNVMGLCLTTREAVKNMREYNTAGHIVHMNSIAGHKVTYFPESNVYPASKHAVTALTETLRIEMNSFNLKIKVSSISPGLVNTDIITNGGFPKDHPQHNIMKTFPSLEPEDVAEAILFVLSAPPHVQIHELTIKPLNEEY